MAKEKMVPLPARATLEMKKMFERARKASGLHSMGEFIRQACFEKAMKVLGKEVTIKGADVH